MKNNKITLSIILSVSVILLFLTFSGFANAQTYNNVTTITGASDQTTDYFTIPSGEWRIIWSYTPTSAYPQYAAFAVYAFPKGETAIYTESIYQTGDNKTSGYTYIHEGNSDYYLKVSVANLDSYTITIEAQSATTANPTPTVPEFPTLIILPIFAIAILLSIVLVKKKISKNNPLFVC